LFVVTELKPREVFAANFKDRVVHHLLVNYLEPIWEPKFIDQSYSCRKRKGAHKAILDLKRYTQLVRQYRHRYGLDQFVKHKLKVKFYLCYALLILTTPTVIN